MLQILDSLFPVNISICATSAEFTFLEKFFKSVTSVSSYLPSSGYIFFMLPDLYSHFSFLSYAVSLSSIPKTCLLTALKSLDTTGFTLLLVPSAKP